MKLRLSKNGKKKSRNGQSLQQNENDVTSNLPTENGETWFKPTDPLVEPVPELEFIVEGYCARGHITVLGGSAGSGKSLLNQFLFQKRNKNLLQTKKGKAIYLTGADSSEYEIRRRAKNIKENKGLFSVELPDNLYCVATNEEFMEELTERIKTYNADVIIFDTLADFHEGNLYEAELANETMREFRILARKANVAVILITHTRKGSKVKSEYNVEDISDSRVFGTKADFVFGLKSEYHTNGSNLIELQCVKSRCSEPIKNLRAEIYYNKETRELKIEKTDRMFSTELAEKSKEEKRNYLIREVGRLKKEKESVRNIADELDIGIGTVSKYSKIYNEQFSESS